MRERLIGQGSAGLDIQHSDVGQVLQNSVYPGVCEKRVAHQHQVADIRTVRTNLHQQGSSKVEGDQRDSGATRRGSSTVTAYALAQEGYFLHAVVEGVAVVERHGMKAGKRDVGK